MGLPFLSEGAYAGQTDAVDRLSARLSVLTGPEDGGRVRLPRVLEEEIRYLTDEIAARKLFLSSFTENPKNPVEKIGQYENFATFLFALGEAVRQSPGADFLIIHRFRTGRIVLSSEARDARLSTARLAVDLCEHAYFPDYGEDRDAYLRAALPFLDVSRLSV